MPTILNPRPGNIQTIIVDKGSGINLKAAKAKAIKAGAKKPIGDELIDETEKAFRFRQRNPSDFIKGSFRSFKVPEQGVIIVYGKLKDNKMSEEFRSAPIILSEEAIPKKIQILRCGNFFHDGREINVCKTDLDHMIRNFSERVRGIDLMIDFSHNSEGEAAGWIKNLILSEDKSELWAEVEWTPVGIKSLENKAFRYISADFSFAYKDNESAKEFGPTLFGAGLTNRPVVKSMEPIVLSEINNNQLTKVEKMANGDYEEKLQEDDKDLSAEELKKIIQDLKDDLLKKDEELISLRNSLEESNLEKEEKLAELKKEKELADKNQSFDQKLSEGLVVEAQRQPFIDSDMDKFLSLQKELKLSESGNPGQAETLNKDNFEDRVLKLAEEKVKKENISLDVAIGEVLSENKESKKLYSYLA